MPRAEIIAHRGASAYAPENTMPSFDLAVRLEAGLGDMLETLSRFYILR